MGFDTALDEFLGTGCFHYAAAPSGGDAAQLELDSQDLKKIERALGDGYANGRPFRFSLSNVTLVSSRARPVCEKIVGAVTEAEHVFRLSPAKVELALLCLNKWNQRYGSPEEFPAFAFFPDVSSVLFSNALSVSPRRGGLGGIDPEQARLEEGLLNLLASASRCWEEIQLDEVMVCWTEGQSLPLSPYFFSRLLSRLGQSGTLKSLSLRGAPVDAAQVSQFAGRHPGLASLTCSLTAEHPGCSLHHRAQLFEGLLRHPALRELHFCDTRFNQLEYAKLMQLLDHNYRIEKISLSPPEVSSFVSVAERALLGLHQALMNRMQLDPEHRFRHERLNQGMILKNLVETGFLEPGQASCLASLLKQSSVESTAGPEEGVKREIYKRLPEVYRAHRDYIDKDWSVMQLDLCAVVSDRDYSVGAYLLSQAAASNSVDGIQCLLQAGANPVEKLGDQSSLLVWALTDGREATPCGDVVIKHLKDQKCRGLAPCLGESNLYHGAVFEKLRQIGDLLTQSLSGPWVLDKPCLMLEGLYTLMGTSTFRQTRKRRVEQLEKAFGLFVQLVNLGTERRGTRDTVGGMRGCVLQLRDITGSGIARDGARPRQLFSRRLSAEFRELEEHLFNQRVDLCVESIIGEASVGASTSKNLEIRRRIQGGRVREEFMTPKSPEVKPSDGKQGPARTNARGLHRSLSSPSYFSFKCRTVADHSTPQPSQAPRLAWR